MVFSSPIFLFAFLPMALFLYYLSPYAIKNITLLILSLFFYAWGEVFYLGVMISSIAANYVVGLLIYQAQQKHSHALCTVYVQLGVLINIALLASYKYANFIVDNINSLSATVNLPPILIEPVHLPLGISFFTFQAISYIVDVYRKEVPAQKNIFNLALYISLFPQLIAGPIVRYHDVCLQIGNRTHSIDLFASGAKRFIYGLAKKMLLANPLGEVADTVFAFSGQDVTMPLAWIGILAYSLQIYFDFSAYSDMAIGLGRMFGFRFLENFNYPYISKSLREFWRRWHISLSTWFRDYVYIPLGGNRVSTLRVYGNLLLVFILTGFWHGASWNFLIWGLFHGVFLASEHAGFSRTLNKAWLPLQHLYLLLVVIVGWVFFRIENLPLALDYLYAMIDVRHFHTTPFQYAQVLTYEAVYAFMVAILLSMPVFRYTKTRLQSYADKNALRMLCCMDIPRLMLLSVLLYLSILKIASSTYNPFIYFRF